MPRRPLRSKKSKLVGVNEDWVDKLITGHVLGHDLPFDSMDHAREVWDAHREQLMGLQGKEYMRDVGGFWCSAGYFDFGMRPWGWWQFDCPGERPLYPSIINQFEYLKEHDLLFEGEEKLYLQQEEQAENERLKIRNQLKPLPTEN